MAKKEKKKEESYEEIVKWIDENYPDIAKERRELNYILEHGTNEDLIRYYEKDFGPNWFENYQSFVLHWQLYKPHWTSEEYERRLLETRDEITKAFADVPYPGRAITIDPPPDPEVLYIQKQIRGRRWQNIKGNELCAISWSYLTPPAYLYYLPAGMLNPCEPGDPGGRPGDLQLLVPDLKLIYAENRLYEHLTDEEALAVDYWVECVSLFNAVQKRAIAHYIQLWCYYAGGDPYVWRAFGLYWKDYV
jgi:hypothetical protein